MSIITPQFITEVKRLQEVEGLSQRAIAKHLGVSKITIVRALYDGYDISLSPTKKVVSYRRCSSCGGKQRADQECQVCSARETVDRNRALNEFSSWFEQLLSPGG